MALSDLLATHLFCFSLFTKFFVRVAQKAVTCCAKNVVSSKKIFHKEVAHQNYVSAKNIM